MRKTLMAAMLAAPLMAVSLVASAADPVAPSRTTPADLVIKEGVETRIACDHNGGYSKYSGVYHYRVVLPKGYHGDATKSWPAIFVASPGGNASMGNSREARRAG